MTETGTSRIRPSRATKATIGREISAEQGQTEIDNVIEEGQARAQELRERLRSLRAAD